MTVHLTTGEGLQNIEKNTELAAMKVSHGDLTEQKWSLCSKHTHLAEALPLTRGFQSVKSLDLSSFFPYRVDVCVCIS